MHVWRVCKTEAILTEKLTPLYSCRNSPYITSQRNDFAKKQNEQSCYTAPLVLLQNQITLFVVPENTE